MTQATEIASSQGATGACKYTWKCSEPERHFLDSGIQEEFLILQRIPSILLVLGIGLVIGICYLGRNSRVLGESSLPSTFNCKLLFTMPSGQNFIGEETASRLQEPGDLQDTVALDSKCSKGR